ncbi:4231_t:CDS:2 [Cetraspora pellucida]|uniref:4231_t:CDS:1 n=1 Tax=Cetraspora pellucida TaxID=1433469 RepID=A0A9N8ZT46_9GLOM|nr:4231_t:CDS:2 [Cetraspora pellucida]
MPRIYTLSDIGEGNREIAIECGNRLANKCSILDKDNKHIQQLDTLTSQINQLQISNTKYGAKDIIRLKKIKSLQSMNKILKSKLVSAQKDAFSTQKEIVKKESEIISLKSELTNIKNELMNTKDELASKIKKIKYLVTLHSVSQKTKDILDPVESKTHCSAIVIGGEEKNMQSEEQSFILNSRNTSESRPEGSLLCRPFKGDSSSHKSLAKYFKSKTLPIITNNQNSESLIQDITNKQNPESLIQDITNKQKPESLIQDITIKETSEGTNVPKPIMNEQSEEAVLQVFNSSDIQKKSKERTIAEQAYIDEANKHESIRNVGYPAMSWPFSKVFTSISGKGKTNIVGNLVLEDKAENIYKGNPKAPYYENIRFKYILSEKIPSIKSFSSERSIVIIFEDLYVAPNSIYITQKYHHVPIIIRENLTHLVIFNGGSSYQDVSKIIGRYTDNVKNASMVINSYLRKNEFIVFDLTRSEDDPLAICLRFDTPLDLHKEIELCQKHKIKNALPAEPKKTEKLNK